MEEKRRDAAGAPPPPPATAEAPPSDPPASRRRGGSHKRKSTSINNSGGSASQTTSSKRQAREKPQAVPFAPIYMNGPCTRARLQPFNSSAFSEAMPLKSEAEARDAAARADEMVRMSANREALEAEIEAEYEAVRSRDVSVHVVPVHAGWFSWTKIHPLEESMLPSFFNGKSESRTPEIYLEIRNWIMKKFHLNPNAQIELEHLSELTVGELDARQEVMEFLDYWGLINYHPLPHQEPDAMTVDADNNKDEAGKMDSLVEKLFRFETVQSWTPVVPKMNMAIPAMSSGLFPESVVGDDPVKSDGPSVEYHCNSCSGDCSRKRYHCQKQADFDLCADCFNNGKFDSDMSPSDFILMESAEAGGVSGGKWTDQETLLLLEAIELFRDNWSEIAEHVATKTKAQCILHFVQMPIEDVFFNHDVENTIASKEDGVTVSTPTENSALKTDQDTDAVLKDAPENRECQEGTTTDIQDASCPIEISKPDEAEEPNQSPEVGESFALKALKDAFETVGSLSSAGERLSFAEAGNPVMALAAFLVLLVEPNIANASVRSFLKSLSDNYSSEQLAARHCFPLEDPPDDKKNLADTEGAATETIDSEDQKDKDERAEKPEEPVVNGFDLPDDENDGKKDSTTEEQHEKMESASEDKKPVVTPSSDCANRSDVVNEPDRSSSHDEAQPAAENEPSGSDLPKEHMSKDAKESVVLPSDTDLLSGTVKESKDDALAGEASQPKEPVKDEDMISTSEKKDADLVVTEKVENTGDREAKEGVSEKKEPPVTKNDLDTDKLKRAAVTALSAAAVKAKLLADQEEDQILQLSTLLVEKQLHKLETKLAFFSDLENVVMRVKEQLDRSKQRLFHERAQIIATRFGMPASARPNTQNLPPNRGGVGFPNSGPRPLMGMNALRPPISRPIMAANPASSTSVQPNSDKLSTVAMK